MPMVEIKLTESIPRKNFAGMIKEVSNAVAKHQGCPIEAVSINIIELPLDRMGTGGKAWKEIKNED